MVQLIITTQAKELLPVSKTITFPITIEFMICYWVDASI